MEPGVLGQTLALQTSLAGDPPHPTFTWRTRLGGRKHDWREGAGLEARGLSLLLRGALETPRSPPPRPEGWSPSWLPFSKTSSLGQVSKV